MTINPIDGLQAHIAQKTQFSNGNAKVTLAEGLDARSLVSQSSSVIYHQSLQEVPLTEAPGATAQIVYSRPVEPTAQEQARYAEIFYLFGHGLANASADLRAAYDDALSQLPPALIAKDWGFSVDHRGSIIIQKGSDSLSPNEQETIEKVFAKAQVGTAAAAVADIVERMLELDRMPAGVSSSMGRFDVTRHNFQEIVDLRAYLNSHGPNAKYGRHLNNPNDHAALYYVSGGIAMMEQISIKAEAKYAYKSPLST